MNATKLRPKLQITLPAEVCDAAGLSVTDLVEWSCEGGRIVGRRLEPKQPPTVRPLRRKGRLMLPRTLEGTEITRALRLDRDAQ